MKRIKLVPITKRRKVYLQVKEIPPKINEIISYLATDFSRNKLLNKDDLAQDLYVLYLTQIKKRPRLAKMKDGYWFVKFKWFLLTKWRKQVRSINREWAYIRQQSGQLNAKELEKESYTGQDEKDAFDQNLDKKRKKKKHRRPTTKYGF